MRALLVAVALLGSTVAGLADSRSATLGVSLTVVRSCTVASASGPGVLTLACSRGVNSVSVSSDASSSPNVRPLTSGANALDVTAAAREPLTVVTINF